MPRSRIKGLRMVSMQSLIVHTFTWIDWHANSRLSAAGKRFQARTLSTPYENQAVITNIDWPRFRKKRYCSDIQFRLYSNLVSTALYTDPKDPSPIFSCSNEKVTTYGLSIVLELIAFTSKNCSISDDHWQGDADALPLHGQEGRFWCKQLPQG
jgi:hypothetical protein